MKNPALLFIGLLLLGSCKDQEVETPADNPPVVTSRDTLEKPVNEAMQISAGEHIGNVSLEMNASKIDSLLGAPDMSDAAMGKAWLTWYSASSEAISGKYELNIYTTYKNNDLREKMVRLIRVTSPDFKFSDTLSTGKPFADFRKKQPDIKYVGSYPYDTTKDFVELYDDKNAGISFEFLASGANKHCIAIIVHRKGKNVVDDYRTFRPDMVLVN